MPKSDYYFDCPLCPPSEARNSTRKIVRHATMKHDKEKHFIPSCRAWSKIKDLPDNDIFCQTVNQHRYLSDHYGLSEAKALAGIQEIKQFRSEAMGSDPAWQADTPENEEVSPQKHMLVSNLNFKELMKFIARRQLARRLGGAQS